MAKEEKFIQSLYDEANEQLKEVYKEQKQNRDELLREIALIMLTYNVLDGLMSLKSRDKRKEYKRLAKLITSTTRSQKGRQTRVINNILNNTVRNTFDFYSYNANLKDVKKIIENNFKGKHFSTRVWENEKAVGKHLHKQVKQFLDGKINVNQIKKDIEKTYNANEYNAKRLTETEVARCSSNAFDRFCIETGVEKVRYNATLDRRLCSDCAQYHDRVFNFKDKIELPKHPLCRCFYTIEDDKTFIQTGGKFTKGSIEWWDKRVEDSDEYYKKIRESKNDIDKISNNTGWTKNSITKIKDHIFYNEHILRNGSRGLLDSDYDMAIAWQRLIDGNFKERDILLLKHEYLESILEKKYNLSNAEAHKRTTKLHDWVKVMENETGGGEDGALDEFIKSK
ncbi:minor capsid protein [Clostridium tetani]|uniref:minor capsid protein n=1 Tax=Clostridium tetani TaxID=1513 RepID=UPI001FB05A7A|nr:minor capsid protein [Clostridium tetani]